MLESLIFQTDPIFCLEQTADPIGVHLGLDLGGELVKKRPCLVFLAQQMQGPRFEDLQVVVFFAVRQFHRLAVFQTSTKHLEKDGLVGGGLGEQSETFGGAVVKKERLGRLETFLFARPFLLQLGQLDQRAPGPSRML